MKTAVNTILITGGGSGIGRELALRFNVLGNTVIVAGRHKEALDEFIVEVMALFHHQPTLREIPVKRVSLLRWAERDG